MLFEPLGNRDRTTMKETGVGITSFHLAHNIKIRGSEGKQLFAASSPPPFFPIVKAA